MAESNSNTSQDDSYNYYDYDNDYEEAPENLTDSSLHPVGLVDYSEFLSGSAQPSDSLFSSYNHNSSNSTFDLDRDDGAGFVVDVVTYMVICCGLPLTLVAVSSLYSLVHNDNVAPLYVMNLLVSDVLQFCCMVVEMVRPADVLTAAVFRCLYHYALMTSVGFMVCIALERYLLIVHPLWYRFRRTIGVSVAVCGVVWFLPSVYFLTLFLGDNFEVVQMIAVVFLLLPFPLLIFFLGATFRALFASISVPSDEKRRILGVLMLVLLIYSLLFLPNTVLVLAVRDGHNSHIDALLHLSVVLLKLSPLADLTLYVFMRRGSRSVLDCVCPCRMKRMNKNNTSTEAL